MPRVDVARFQEEGQLKARLHSSIGDSPAAMGLTTSASSHISSWPPASRFWNSVPAHTPPFGWRDLPPSQLPPTPFFSYAVPHSMANPPQNSCHLYPGLMRDTRNFSQGRFVALSNDESTSHKFSATSAPIRVFLIVGLGVSLHRIRIQHGATIGNRGAKHYLTNSLAHPHFVIAHTRC